MNFTPRPVEISSGFYLLSYRQAPTGANRVEFQIARGRVNVNNAGWRRANPGEVEELEKLHRVALNHACSLVTAGGVL